MSVEYTDAPAPRPASTEVDKVPCPYCGHLLAKDAESCDRCDWTRSATAETAEGKASDAVAVPAGIFVLLAAIASAGFGLGLFFFYLIAVMLHAYAVDDRVVPPKEDEGEEY